MHFGHLSFKSTIVFWVIFSPIYVSGFRFISIIHCFCSRHSRWVLNRDYD